MCKNMGTPISSKTKGGPQTGTFLGRRSKTRSLLGKIEFCVLLENRKFLYDGLHCVELNVKNWGLRPTACALRFRPLIKPRLSGVSRWLGH